MKITIKGFVHYRKEEEWTGYGNYRIFPYKSEYDGAVYIAPCSVEVEIPDDFNPIPAQVAALEKEKRELQAKFAKELMDIDDRISKLTCITMDEPS